MTPTDDELREMAKEYLTKHEKDFGYFFHLLVQFARQVLEQHPDSKRLDWLEKEDAGIYSDTDGRIGVARGNCEGEFYAGDTLRDAIDKAMEGE